MCIKHGLELPEFMIKNSKDTDIYNCSTNKVVCGANNYSFEIGQGVKLVNDFLGVDGRSSRIQEYTKNLANYADATYQVGDNSKYSRLSSIEGDISSGVDFQKICKKLCKQQQPLHNEVAVVLSRNNCFNHRFEP